MANNIFDYIYCESKYCKYSHISLHKCMSHCIFYGIYEYILESYHIQPDKVYEEFYLYSLFLKLEVGKLWDGYFAILQKEGVSATSVHLQILQL